MKVNEYNQMMAYLTRPEPEVLPQPKPQELLDIQEDNRKGRLLDSLNKIGGRLEDSSLDFINRENFAEAGGVFGNTAEKREKTLKDIKTDYHYLKWDHMMWKAKDGQYKCYNIDLLYRRAEEKVTSMFYWVNGDAE